MGGISVFVNLFSSLGLVGDRSGSAPTVSLLVLRCAFSSAVWARMGLWGSF